MSRRRPSASSAQQPVQRCRQCAVCCRKGGPAFHGQDRHLIDSGQIPSEHLFTIRKGEPAHDNVTGTLAPAPQDIIKIKGRGGDWTCTYLDEAANRCTIYDFRPMECRLLKCWAPEALQAAYDKNRLTRRDLLASHDALWKLIVDHDVRCDYPILQDLVKRLQSDPGDEPARRRISEMIHFDRQIRRLMSERGALAPERLDFLFGRPPTTILAAMGTRLHQDADGRWHMPL